MVRHISMMILASLKSLGLTISSQILLIVITIKFVHHFNHSLEQYKIFYIFPPSAKLKLTARVG